MRTPGAFRCRCLRSPGSIRPDRLKAFVDRLIDSLLCFAGFDFLVDPVFDEDAD